MRAGCSEGAPGPVRNEGAHLMEGGHNPSPGGIYGRKGADRASWSRSPQPGDVMKQDAKCRAGHQTGCGAPAPAGAFLPLRRIVRKASIMAPS